MTQSVAKQAQDRRDCPIRSMKLLRWPFTRSRDRTPPMHKMRTSPNDYDGEIFLKTSNFMMAPIELRGPPSIDLSQKTKNTCPNSAVSVQSSMAGHFFVSYGVGVEMHCTEVLQKRSGQVPHSRECPNLIIRNLPKEWLSQTLDNSDEARSKILVHAFMLG